MTGPGPRPDIAFRRERPRSGRFIVYRNGRRVASSATRRGARALVLALDAGRVIERVEGGVVFHLPTPFTVDLNAQPFHRVAE